MNRFESEALDRHITDILEEDEMENDVDREVVERALGRLLKDEEWEESKTGTGPAQYDSISPAPKIGLWEWLEAQDDYTPPPESGRPVPSFSTLCDFYKWGLNYDFYNNPFNLFRDLVGWSRENVGTNLYNHDEGFDMFTYMEAEYLGDALKLWADRPGDVEAWLDRVSELELEDGE